MNGLHHETNTQCDTNTQTNNGLNVEYLDTIRKQTNKKKQDRSWVKTTTETKACKHPWNQQQFHSEPFHTLRREICDSCIGEIGHKTVVWVYEMGQDLYDCTRSQENTILSCLQRRGSWETLHLVQFRNNVFSKIPVTLEISSGINQENGVKVWLLCLCLMGEHCLFIL